MQSQRLLGVEGQHAPMAAAQAGALDLRLPLVELERPLHLAGEAGAARERSPHQARVVVTAKGRRLEGAFHDVER